MLQEEPFKFTCLKPKFSGCDFKKSVSSGLASKVVSKLTSFQLNLSVEGIFSSSKSFVNNDNLI